MIIYKILAYLAGGRAIEGLTPIFPGTMTGLSLDLPLPFSDADDSGNTISLDNVLIKSHFHVFPTEPVNRRQKKQHDYGIFRKHCQRSPGVNPVLLTKAAHSAATEPPPGAAERAATWRTNCETGSAANRPPAADGRQYSMIRLLKQNQRGIMTEDLFEQQAGKVAADKRPSQNLGIVFLVFCL